LGTLERREFPRVDLMKSTFFHIGVNRTMARRENLQEPRIRPDGSIPYVPLPNHPDPDFENLTYGDPFGRLDKFEKEDIAWFIESASNPKDNKDWGYYLIGYFVTEAVYSKVCLERKAMWVVPYWFARELYPRFRGFPKKHFDRVKKNAHETRGDRDYSIILGDKDRSRLLFNKPFRLSNGEDPYLEAKRILGLPKRPLKGYWWKKWFDDKATNRLLQAISQQA